MTDSLREKLVYTCKDVCNLNLSEAEQDNYPYVVFDMTTSPLKDKDGVYAYSGDTSIRIVGTVLSALETLRSSIESAIETGMRNESFSSTLADVNEECTDGIWTIELNYTLKQYADWSEPVETTNTD